MQKTDFLKCLTALELQKYCISQDISSVRNETKEFYANDLINFFGDESALPEILKEIKGASFEIPKEEKKPTVKKEAAKVETKKAEVKQTALPLDTKQPVQPEPVKIAPSPTVVDPLAAIIAQHLNGLIDTKPQAAPIDEGQIISLIQNELKGHKKSLEIKTPTSTTEIKAPHYQLEKVLKLVTALKNILLVGDSGTGKTYLALQCAEALNLPFSSISCSEGIDEVSFSGYMDANGVFRSTEYIKLFTTGGVFCLDEVDAADANVLLYNNSAISNGFLTLPNGETVKRHENFYLICCANTVGNGATEKFNSRNTLDAAFLARFELGRLLIDYDTNYEKSVLSDQKTCNGFHAVRTYLQSTGSRKTLTTRVFKDGAKLLSIGYTPTEIISQFVNDCDDSEAKRIKDTFLTAYKKSA